MVAGVCAGLAGGLRVPVIIVRLAVVVLTVTGIGAPLYVLAALFFRDDAGERFIDRRGTRELLLFAAVVVLMWVTIPSSIDGSRLAATVPWLIVLAGLGLLVRADPGTSPIVEPDAGPGHPDPGSGVGTSPVAAVAPTEAAAGDPAVPYRPFVGPAAAGPNVVDPARPSATAAKQFRAADMRRWAFDHFPVLGPISLLVAAALAMALVMVGVAPGVIVGVVVCALGSVMLLGSKFGRARGLVIPAAVLCLAIAPAVAAGVRAETGVAPHGLQRAVGDSAPPSVHAAVGSLRIDLSNLESKRDVDLAYELAAGDIELVLPMNMVTEVTADVRVGSLAVNDPSADLALVQPGSADRARNFLAMVSKDPRVDDESINALFGASGVRPGAISLLDGNVPFAESLDVALRHYRSVVTPPTGVEDAKPASGGTLKLKLTVGAGEIRIVRPFWVNIPDPASIRDPFQVCAESGGFAGFVKACGELPKDRQIPTCLTQTPYVGYTKTTPPKPFRSADAVADCRSLAVPKPGVPQRTLIVACNDGLDRFVSCTDVGVANQTSVEVDETEVAELGDDLYSPAPAGTIAPLKPTPPSNGPPETVVSPPVTTVPSTLPPPPTTEGSN